MTLVWFCSQPQLPEIGDLIVQLNGAFDPRYMYRLVSGRLASHRRHPAVYRCVLGVR
jgi:hypothetical protein